MQLTATYPIKTQSFSSEHHILLAFLYYALLPNFLRFLFGAAILGQTPFKEIIALAPFGLAIIWYLVKYAPEKVRLNSFKLRISFFGLLMVALTLILFYAYVVGTQNRNLHRLGDIAGWLMLLSLSAISYFTIRDIGEVEHFLQRMTLPLALLAVLQLIAVGFQRIGVNMTLYPYWTDSLLLYFSLCWYVSRLILEPAAPRKNLLLIILILAAVAVQFSKPMLWSLLSTMLFISLVAGFLRRFDRVIFTLLIGTIAGIVLFLLAQTALNIYFDVSLLDSFTQDFERTYLKYQDPFNRYQGDLDGGRLDLWERTIKVFEKEPWLGQGLGIGILVFPTIPPVAVHNTVFYLLAATGLIGFSVAAALLLNWLSTVLKTLRWHQYLSLKLALLGYVFCMLMFGLVGTMWITTSGMIFMGFAMGTLLRIQTIEQENNAHQLKS